MVHCYFIGIAGCGVPVMLWLFQVRHLEDIYTGKDTIKREQNKGLASIFFERLTDWHFTVDT